MKQELLAIPWRLPLHPPSHRPFSSLKPPRFSSLTETLADSITGGELTAKERRQLRKERRESRAGEPNWRDEVEERLMVKPKREHKSWTEKLNLDNLALLGTQWWVVRVSRVNGQETAAALARQLVRNYPDSQFKVYYPAVREQRKLKNGSLSVKLKPLFPGCVFLNCILNKEIHDFIRECDGVGGFLGSKVGNTKRQINRSKPVPVDEMEAIFRQAKEEQEKANQAFKEEELKSINSIIDSASNQKSTNDAKPAKPKRKTKKGSDPSKSSALVGDSYKGLAPGTSVRVLSGPFTEFSGRLKELDHKNGKILKNKKSQKLVFLQATIGFKFFGKESFVEMELEQIVAETT